jgi:hypothetical protein
VNVFENRVLRRICEPKRDENAVEWRKLHKEELNKLSSFSNIIRQIKARRKRWTGNVARMGLERKVYRLLVGKPEVKRPLGRGKRGWEDGIRMGLGETGWVSVEWIQLAQDRGWWLAVLNAVINLRTLVPRSLIALHVQ